MIPNPISACCRGKFMLRIIQLIASNPVRMLSVSLWLTPAAIVMYRYAHNSRLEAQDFFYCAAHRIFWGMHVCSVMAA